MSSQSTNAQTTVYEGMGLGPGVTSPPPPSDADHTVWGRRRKRRKRRQVAQHQYGQIEGGGGGDLQIVFDVTNWTFLCQSSSSSSC